MCVFKFLGKMEVDGKSGITHTDKALRSFKTLKERKKQRIIIQVNPEVIRVVSAKDSVLLFDQAVDKISFCAPSNVYPDAFRYSTVSHVHFVFFPSHSTIFWWIIN